jgi:MFS superfamily sulfate permease-like transporter
LEVDLEWYLADRATVIVLIALMKSNGLEYVFAAVALAGVIQILIGLFKLGKFIRLVPQPVMFGFVNGLAIIIFMSQLEQFKTVVNGRVFGYQVVYVYARFGGFNYCNCSLSS